MTGIAVVGVGRWGPHLARVFSSSPDTRVLYIVDRDEARLSALEHFYPNAIMSQTMAPALDDDEVDGVVVATPAATHHKIAAEALDAGKHVLVEKPMTTSTKDAADLTERAEKASRVLMVGHVFLYNPSFKEADRYISEGAIGDLLSLSMRRTNLGPRMTGTTVTWDLIVHDIAIANKWTNSQPIAVMASGRSFYVDGEEDLVFASVEYPNGVLMHVHASWIDPKKTRFVTAVGSAGMLTVDDLDEAEPLRLYDSQIEERPAVESDDGTLAAFKYSIRNGAVSIPSFASAEPLAMECDEFLRRIRTGSDKLAGAHEGIAVVRTLEAIDQSLRAGARVEL